MYAIGVLWNVAQKFSRDIMMETALKYPVIQVAVFDLGENYEKFIRKLYAIEDMSDFRIKKKLEYMDFAENSKIISFLIDIGDGEYKFVERKSKHTCVQIEGYKKNIRERYSGKLPKYYFDTILHMTDDEEEFDYSVKVLEEYKRYCVESYLKKGYTPIVSWNNPNTKKNEEYDEILDKMGR